MAATPPARALARVRAARRAWSPSLSASQDVVIDAYRTDLLPAAERGIGSSLNVLGYRLAMILSGGIALIWVDAAPGRRLELAARSTALMALLMVGAAVFSALLAAAPASRAAKPSSVGAQRRARLPRRRGRGRRRLRRHATTRSRRGRRALLAPLFGAPARRRRRCRERWADLVALLLGIALHAAAGGVGGAARALRDACSAACASYFSQAGARRRSSPSSCSTSSATRSPAR